MKKIIIAITAQALIFSLSLPVFADMGAAYPETAAAVSGYVSVSGGDIEIASGDKAPVIYVDGVNDYAGVARAAADLSEDIKAVTDVTAEITSDAEDADIIIGTIGKSAAVDALIESNSLDVSEIEGEWEAFTLRNVNGTLVIAGADKRGTIYGIYDLSEKMGVSPWEWWADVTPGHSDAVYVTLPEGGYTEGASSVKYRGIFINQEYNLWNWAKSLDSDVGINTKTYKKVFELLLRLKANYMWPAMHEFTQAFNVNPENARLADEYGIVMGSSHCEMLLRNNMGELLDFQNRWIEEHPDKTLYMFKDGSLNANVAYDYTDKDADGNSVCNKEFIEDYWRERVRANKAYESNFTIGMRGVHDGAWNPVNAKTTETKIALLEEIIAKQRQILSEEIGKPAEEIPQTFIPYKEIADLYNAGLSVPDDVTIMFTNDNYGHVRQCMTEEERKRAGGGGMYYHVSYYGRPSSVIWNGGTQLGLIKEEMTKAYDGGANTVWVLNVGPLKGFENQTEYFLDLGRNIDKAQNTSVKAYVTDNAKRYFGFDDERAEEYADIQCEFLEAANARRPDFRQQGLYSLTAYGDEGQKELDRYADLLERSEALYNSLPADLRPAFYELQLYAVKSAYNVISSYIGADKAALYKARGRGACVNKYTEMSKTAWARLTDDMNEYNTMLGGKWNNVVNPFQKTESGSWDIMRNWTKDGGAAASETVNALTYTDMGIAVENQTDADAAPELEFSGYTKDVRFIDIFNTGTGSLDWKAASDADWIVFNKESGTVYDDDRIYAGIDWDKAPEGLSGAEITITRYIGDNAVKSAEIAVKVNNSVKALPEKTYAEANGYVSIEAEHYSRSIASGVYEWREQDDFGRSGNSMKFMQNNAERLSDNGAYLEYDVYFESTGTFDADVYRMPTLNERGSVSFAIGMDDAAPTVLNGCNAYYNNSSGTDKWGKGILNNIEVLSSTVSVDEEGIHKIRLYGIDPGAVVDKLVITTGTKYESYYGAPESFNTTYNNGGETVTEGVVTGAEPRLITDTEGVGVIAAYNAGGALVSARISEDYSDGAFVFSEPLLLGEGERVKGMVWSSLAEMRPLSGVYGKAETEGGGAVMPEPSEPSTEIVGDITALFEPKLYTSGAAADGSRVTSVDIIKLSDVEAALLTVAAYTADGVMTGSKTVSADFSAAGINEKVSVPVDFAIPSGSAETQVIVYGGTSTLNALSPAYTVSTDGLSLTALYEGGAVELKSSLDSYSGREAICRISRGEDTVYIKQQTVANGTFKRINTGEMNGTYDVHIGVSGEGIVISETVNTVKNIGTDTEPAEVGLYGWDFDSDRTGTGTDVPVLGGNAVYDEVNKCIKLTSTAEAGGSLTVDLSEAVTAAHGERIVVVSKIAYGNLSGKYMTYELTDSSGNMLVRSKINRYTGKTQTLTIGGAEQLTDGNYPSAIVKVDNSAAGPAGKYSIYTVTIDPASDEISVVISNTENSDVNEYSGRLPEGTSYDLKKLYFTTDYNNAARTCYVDDISISKLKDAAYTISFVPTDGENPVDGALISVADAVTGAVIAPNANGGYELCDGVYSYTVTADGYETVTDNLELSPATESKTVTVRMKPSGGAKTPPPTAPPAEYDNTAGYWLFDFGADTAEGCYGVTSDTSFTDDLTYGFIGVKEEDYKLESGQYMDGFRTLRGQTIALADGTGAADAPNNDFVAVTDERYPIRFTMSAENGGYYHVKVTLANASRTEPAYVSLFTECRRQLLTEAEIPAGETLEYEFNVDVETYYRKARSGQYKDDTISVEVTGKNAAIASMEVEKAEQNGKTIWVLSDSTGCDQFGGFPYFGLDCYAGVGQAFAKYLPKDTALSNQGDGGIASNDTNHYKCAKDAFKPGDYLYIEYGHNETSIDGYTSNLEKYYTDCRAAGVNMIVAGPIDRCQTKQFDSETGTWSSTLGGYSAAAKRFVEDKIAAGAEDIAFVDINAGWIEFLNDTTERVRALRGSDSYEADSVYYYYKHKASGIDTTHINDAGADNAAYIFFTEAKRIVDAGRADGADASAAVQARVLSGLTDGMREQTPYSVSDEIIKAGKVPNSYYPEPVYEEYEGYEAKISGAAFDGNTLRSVTAKVEYYTGFEAKGIPYGVAVAEMYDADGALAGTYMTAADTKYDATNGNGTFTLIFNAGADMQEGGSYRIWLQGFTSDNELMEGETYRVSDYFTPESAAVNYLIGDYDDIEVPDSFSYYGVKTGADLNGNNGWYIVGSATRSATLEKETLDGEAAGYAQLVKGSKTGSYIVYRAFGGDVTAGRIVLDTDLYYEEGQLSFVLSNSTSSPNSGYSQRVTCFGINGGKLYDSAGSELCDFPVNEWTHIRYTLDMDYGTQELETCGGTYAYAAEGMDALVPAGVKVSKLGQLNISGSSSSTMKARLRNVSAKSELNGDLPEYTLTLSEPDGAEGSVNIDGGGLTVTRAMNSLLSISARPADDYIFIGWYDEEDKLVSPTADTQIRLHRDVTLTAKFEQDNDPVEYAYKQTFTSLTTETLAENGFTSKNAQSSLTVESDEEHGNYLYFNPGGNTRNMKLTLPETARLNEKYILEADFALVNGTGSASELTIFTSDTTVPDNASTSGEYLLKLTSTASSKTMPWTINENADDTVTLAQDTRTPVWSHLKLTVDPEAGSAELVVTDKDGAEVYNNTVTPAVTNGNYAAAGLNFNAVKTYSRCQLDNIRIYAAAFE